MLVSRRIIFDHLLRMEEATHVLLELHWEARLRPPRQLELLLLLPLSVLELQRRELGLKLADPARQGVLRHSGGQQDWEQSARVNIYFSAPYSQLAPAADMGVELRERGVRSASGGM